MPRLFGACWFVGIENGEVPLGGNGVHPVSMKVFLCLLSGCLCSWIAMWKTLELQVSWWRGARTGAHELGTEHG